MRVGTARTELVETQYVWSASEHHATMSEKSRPSTTLLMKSRAKFATSSAHRNRRSLRGMADYERRRCVSVGSSQGEQARTATQ